MQAFGKVNSAEDVTRRVQEEISKWEKGERNPQYDV